MPDLSTAIQTYLEVRKGRGIAKETIRNDAMHLRALLAVVGNISTRSIKPQHVDRLLTERAHWAPSTKNTCMSALSSFFVWCRSRGYMGRDVDPLEGITKVRAAQRQRVIIPQEEFSTFLAGIKDPRSRAAVAIGLYLFTRISETGNLRWQDDRGTEMEVYRLKTKTIDVLPICVELREELDRWKFAYAAEIGEPVQPGWFIIPRRGLARFKKGTPPGKGRPVIQGDLEPMERASLAWTMTKCLTDAGYYRAQEGGHTLRRSGAIALYNQLTHMGHDRAMRVVQAMLGHSNLSTTEIYLRLDLDRKVRNDLLGGQPMFPTRVEADVVDLRRVADGKEDRRHI